MVEVPVTGHAYACIVGDADIVTVEDEGHRLSTSFGNLALEYTHTSSHRHFHPLTFRQHGTTDKGDGRVTGLPFTYPSSTPP